MPRREKTITITQEGRDKGKSFLMREMPADQGERWANRVILALANAGAKLPEGILDAGMSGLSAIKGPLLAVMGIRALQGLNYVEIDPLLAEMMAQIQFKPPGPFEAQTLIDGENSQIEEITTRWKLRLEYVEFLMGFSLAGILSTTDFPLAGSPAYSITPISPAS
jgi:hypothetical protein